MESPTCELSLGCQCSQPRPFVHPCIIHKYHHEPTLCASLILAPLFLEDHRSFCSHTPAHLHEQDQPQLHHNCTCCIWPLVGASIWCPPSSCIFLSLPSDMLNPLSSTKRHRQPRSLHPLNESPTRYPCQLTPSSFLLVALCRVSVCCLEALQQGRYA